MSASDTANVSVDARGDRLIVSAFSRTTAGFWAMNGRFERLDAGGSALEIGSAVADCLSTSEAGMDLPPRDGPSPFDLILEELGISSYPRYMKGTRSVDVTRTPSGLIVTPRRNEGPRVGFVEIQDLAEEIEDGSPQALGEAVLRALELAQ